MSEGQQMDEDRFEEMLQQFSEAHPWEEAQTQEESDKRAIHFLRCAFFAGKAYGLELRGCCELDTETSVRRRVSRLRGGRVYFDRDARAIAVRAREVLQQVEMYERNPKTPSDDVRFLLIANQSDRLQEHSTRAAQRYLRQHDVRAGK